LIYIGRRSVFRRARPYLYILLQLEDDALLMGSVGLFAVLAAIMYLTRKINWYAIHEARAACS
jgi:inner membrane protein involved in colicin E2 resistance